VKTKRGENILPQRQVDKSEGSGAMGYSASGRLFRIAVGPGVGLGNHGQLRLHCDEALALRHNGRKQLGGPGRTVPSRTVAVGWVQLASFHLIKLFSKYFQWPRVQKCKT
jgi:hypothetical protein